MKKIKLLVFTVVLMGFAFVGCSDPGDVFNRNFAYISEPSAIGGVAYEKMIGFSDADVEFPFAVQLVDYATENVSVNLNVDNITLVKDYNTTNNTTYTAIPQDKITFSGEGVSTDGNIVTVTVPAGKNRTDVNIKIAKYDGMVIGDKYAVAVKLAGIKDSWVTELAPEDWSILLFPIGVSGKTSGDDDMPGITLPTASYPKFKFVRDDANFAISTGLWNARFESDFTLECWLFLSSFGRGSENPTSPRAMNTQIFDNRKMSGSGYSYGLDANVDEFFMRFNNATSNTLSDVEIKAFNGSGAGSPGWMAGEWVHFAIVYKRRDNVLISYRNGEQITRVDGYPEPQGNPNTPGNTDYNPDFPKDGKLRFKLLSMIGTHSGGIGANETMAVRELRMWNVARRPTQIAEYMRLGVNPAEPHLVAYWKFEQPTGSDTPTEFPNVAEWKATDDIPVAPSFKLRNATFFGGWGETVDFNTVQVTLKDGSKSPAAQ